MSKAKTILFYILSFTWGIVMSLIGCAVFAVLIAIGYRPQKFYDRLYIQVGEHWGGVELGPWFLTDKTAGLHTRQHESGHGFQNVILGPFMPFVVCIPSAARYWLRECKSYKIKTIYSICVGVAFALISFAFLIPGLIWGALWATIVGSALLLYTVLFSIWLIFIERPKYQDGRNYPKYDDIWFEGTASSWGAKMFPTEYQK